jgi:hypothetical protein
LDVAIVYGSLLVALITTVACARRAHVAATSPVGPPKLDFAKSWGTNVAVFGVLFGTFFGARIVPTPKYVPDPGYALMSVLFALLALIAPVVFVVLSGPTAERDSTSRDPHNGTAQGFFFAMALTLWAALGQLATLGALTAEVISTNKVPDVTAVLLLVLLAAAIGVVTYAWRTAKPLLDQQAEAFEPHVAAGGPTPGWSLL